MAELNWTPPELPRQQAVFTWNTPYAALVHEGYERTDGTSAPARPWTDYAIANTDIADIFHTELVRHDGNFLRAWIRTAERLGIEFKNSIEAEIWQWDRVTVRQNGDTVGTPRDIVDTGELRDSQNLTFE